MGQLSFCPSVVIAQIYHPEIGKKNEYDSAKTLYLNWGLSTVLSFITTTLYLRVELSTYGVKSHLQFSLLDFCKYLNVLSA